MPRSFPPERLPVFFCRANNHFLPESCVTFSAGLRPWEGGENADMQPFLIQEDDPPEQETGGFLHNGQNLFLPHPRR